jgi:glycosyltransferase involved in cell wall biosynthesis
MNHKNYKIPIVIAAYNRPDSLVRILKGIAKAEYPSEVELIISIDPSKNKEIIRIAEKFQWVQGKKTILRHKEHLGLRKHILACGDIALENDGVIVLEDDLYISPQFYNYTLQAIDFYFDQDDICGISLYNHTLYETAYLPFKPIEDGFDNYMLQIPCSWGQCWTKKQWSAFREWYNKNNVGYKPSGSWLMPEDIPNWPESSWKKYFYFYMLEKQVYFTYPRIGLSTNFSDPGTHIVSKKQAFQISLLYHKKKWDFSTIKTSKAIYDSFCEMRPDLFLSFIERGFPKDIEIDLYGTKPLDQVRSKYLLSTKQCSEPINTYGREMRPAVLNVIEGIPGNDIRLGETKNFTNKKIRKYSLQDIAYFYDMVEWLHFRDIITGINKMHKKKNNVEKTQEINSKREIHRLPPKTSTIKMKALRLIDGLTYHILKQRR